MLAYYGLRRMTRLVDGLVVHAERMEENLLVGSLGLVFSQPVLLALVAAGLSRDAAYRIVQSAARRATEQRQSFRSVLETDADLTAALGAGRVPDVLDEAFDLDRALRHAHRTIDALEDVEE
jgi:adenylosuccinate lyase